MKTTNKVFLVGMISVVLAFGFVLASCKQVFEGEGAVEGSLDRKALTLTLKSKSYEIKYDGKTYSGDASKLSLFGTDFYTWTSGGTGGVTVRERRKTMENGKQFKGGAATFIKGKPYTREYFGIDKNNAYSLHIINGKFCLFLNMYGDFNNEEQEDGFIFEPRYAYELVPEGTKQPAVVSVFIRESTTSEYDYRSDSYAMIRYDEKRNKLLWS